MNANEFRIGNYIRDVGEGEIYQIEEISANHIRAGAMTVYRPGFDHDHYITITEKVLYQLGATKFPSGKMLSLCDRLLDHMDCRNVWIDTQTSVEFKYVHQVQNFIYATKGIELKLSNL